MPLRVRRSKEELIRIWEKIDRNTSGEVQGEDVVKAAHTVEAELPDLLENFEKIAKGGKITRQDFLDFYMGKKSGASAASKKVTEHVDMRELRRVFDEIVGDTGVLRIADIAEHKSELRAVCPALLESFTTADSDKSGTLSWDEVRLFYAGTEEWLDQQFARVIGLDKLKDQLRVFQRSILLDKKRCEGGHDVKSGSEKYHMIFQGNPGTGKTTVARLVADLLKRIGIIEENLLVEVQRDKLVAEYVGQTGPKTQKVIEEAQKGILFIDEAYRLSQGGGKSDFGKEAIEQLMAAMNDPPGKAPVMVFAGYPDDMEAFMNANSGLYRRIAYTFDFDDYSSANLAQILDLQAKKSGFRLAPELTADDYAHLAEIIEANTLPEARSLMNGGICERIYTFAKQSLDAREAERSPGAVPSVDLEERDIIEACKKIPPPPARDSPIAGGGGGGGGDAALEARCEDLEAEVERLRERLARKGDSGEAAGPPRKYEVQPCLCYTGGCLWYFIKVIALWVYKWLCIFARWISSKITGSGAEKTADAPLTADAGP